MYGTKVPRSIWALNFDPTTWPITPISFYPKPQYEPTQTAGLSFVTWSLLGKPFQINKERITSKYTILRMPSGTQGNTVAEHAYWSGNQVPRPLSPHSTLTKPFTYNWWYWTSNCTNYGSNHDLSANLGL